MSMFQSGGWGPGYAELTYDVDANRPANGTFVDPNGWLFYTKDLGATWRVFDTTSQGSWLWRKLIYYNPAGSRPTGSSGENVPRQFANMTDQAWGAALGTMELVMLDLPYQLAVTSFTMVSGATPLVAGTSPNLWGALYDNTLTLLRQSITDQSPVWAANTAKTFILDSVPISAASWAAGAGGTISFTTTAGHGMAVGTIFSTNTCSPAGYNLTNAVVATAADSTHFTTTGTGADPGAFVSGGTAKCGSFSLTNATTFYFGIMQMGTTATRPSLASMASITAINGTQLTPILCGTSTSGLTQQAPNPAGALTTLANVPYFYVTGV